ncbi:hypothetical protein BASA81_013852 [Batrachochytrium salamandrivorans]|nr:hypothetical protein BASA81_013852 [Batrachochytrium salamandrivorans]
MHSESSGRSFVKFTDEEEEHMLELSRSSGLYDRLWKSIAPSISGSYTVDIKKAIACLLFGGSRKRLPDGAKLRGDINLLLLGDPSTAKSQFLKFVERVAPVGVYTSGKGSSAAGLTASVVKDARGEFYLEGGAMILADGGVVCIDEFDKMREQDRVAIHECMEQQTISIAKAGITTILNSRTSVLAAANPVFGTYNDSKSASDNIDFLPTILSRFDMIFIVRDIRDADKDRGIAKHVLGIHVGFAAASKRRRGGGNQGAEQEPLQDGDLELKTMKKYIAYCRTRCAPSLNPAAAEMLRNHYLGQDDLSPEATPEHVAEAIRLFKVSTLNAAQNDKSSVVGLGSLSPDQAKEIQRIEEQIQRMVPIGSVVPTKRLQDDFVLKQGYNAGAVNRALHILVARNEFAYLNQQRHVKRIR